MTKIISWSIINNEIDYIKDIIDYHLSWIDMMYILDTGSTDGSLEYLKEYSLKDNRLIIEEYPIKYVPQYDVEWEKMQNPFPEVTVRNFAIQRAELLNPDWLIQLDGDEVFLSKTKDVILNSKNHSCVGHSTINPVCKLEEHPLERRGGYSLHDPHVRIWKAKQGIKYINNPRFGSNQFHCIPVVGNSTKHLFHNSLIRFIDDPLHFHLHWMYGKKVDFFFKNKNLTKYQIVETQKLNKYSNLLPEIFWDRESEWLKT